MKKRLFIISAILSSIFLSSCSYFVVGDNTEKVVKVEVESKVETETKLRDRKKETSIENTEVEDDSEELSDIEYLREYAKETWDFSNPQRVGNEIVGYFEVPEKFIKFNDLSGTSDSVVQYSDVLGFSVLTISKFEGLEDKASYDTKAEYAASFYIDMHKGNGANVEADYLDIAEKEDINNPSFYVIGDYGSKSIFTLFIESKENGDIYTIAAEGSSIDDSLKEATLRVVSTWSLNE